MSSYKSLLAVIMGGLMVFALAACNGDDDGFDGVRVRGVVDDGLANSPIGNAECRIVDRSDVTVATATANNDGEFSVILQPDQEGLAECFPQGLPGLTLSTFVSTEGQANNTESSTIAELSPRQTLIANIIVAEEAADPLERQQELTQALDDGDPDLMRLAGAATTVFNELLQENIAATKFAVSSDTDASGESDGGNGDASGDGDGGGASGGAGDGGTFSPLVNATCEFASDLRGDNALEDVLSDGEADREELQDIADAVRQDPEIRDAYLRFFPNGMQSLVQGQPLRAQTDADGRYFLPIPLNTPGFITCADPDSQLTLARQIQARDQAGEEVEGQNVYPPSQFFSSLLAPQLDDIGLDVQPIQDNFETDIGNLSFPAEGIVVVETVEEGDGRVVADVDGDGFACGFEDPENIGFQYPAAAGVSYTASVLFKALMVESRAAPTKSFADILDGILTRTNADGGADTAVLAEDLTAGGVPAERSAILADLLDACIQRGVETILGPPLRQRMVRAGRYRLTVQDENGDPASNATVQVTGDIEGESGGTFCPAAFEEVERGADRIACRTNDNGLVVFVLLGKQSLRPTPLNLTITSEDGMIVNSHSVNFAPPATIDDQKMLEP